MDKIAWKVIWKKEKTEDSRSSALIAVGKYKGYDVKLKQSVYYNSYRIKTIQYFYIVGGNGYSYDCEEQLIYAIEKLIKSKEEKVNGE